MMKLILVALLVLCALFAVQESNGEKLDMALSGDFFVTPIRELEHIRNKRGVHSRITIKRTSKAKFHRSSSHQASYSRTGYAAGGGRGYAHSGEDDD